MISHFTSLGRGESIADAAAVAVARSKTVTLRFDQSTTYVVQNMFGPADKLVFKSGRDNATPVDNIFFFDLNNREFAGNLPHMVIDARQLGGVLSDGGNLYEEFAYVGTTHVTTYTVKFLGGDGGDRIQSGVGGDTLIMGGGDDFVSIGAGDDTVRAGTGDDLIESTNADLTTGDVIDGGRGVDQITYYDQSMTDADFVNIRSIEILAPVSDGTLELGANAVAAGIRELFVDSFHQQTVTVTAGFTGTLFLNHLGAIPGALRFDASQSNATITIDAGYDSTSGAPTYVGGSGSEDTIEVSNGYIYEGSPPHGGDLSHVSGFEHVVVEDLGGDSGAYLVLRTAAGDIDAAFQTVDASALGEGKAFELRAGGARADLHVVSGDADDLLTTGRGADVIDGGFGGDTMTGGAGRDTFVYHAVAASSGASVDVILDFASGKDKVDVTGLGADLPSLHGASIDFVGNQEGSARDDRVLARTAGDGVLDAVYRTDTHTLWFDTDDNGKLDSSDLHIGMAAVPALHAADVLAGHVVI